VYEIFGDAMPKDEARRLLGISAKRVILYFGYVRPYKGLMILIDAMKDLATTTSETEGMLLLIVGEFYDDERKYRQKVHDLNLGPCIQFVSDYVPNDRVRLYFSAADVVVLPYLSATQSGITQIAYQFDKPVIATSVGGLPEVVHDGQTGYIVPPNDAHALARALQRFYAEGREKDFAANVHRERAKYSWEHFVEQIESLVS
jgi:glycosyltransferase involved in cell wall biosynthesis